MDLCKIVKYENERFETLLSKKKGTIYLSNDKPLTKIYKICMGYVKSNKLRPGSEILYILH